MLRYTSLQADTGSKLHIERTIFEHVRSNGIINIRKFLTQDSASILELIQAIQALYIYIYI